MRGKIEEIIQGILNLGNALDLRNGLLKKYKKSCFGITEWVLLSRESKIKIIEEINNNPVKEASGIFQSCFLNKTSEFYADKIDFLITYSDRGKLKLKAIEEGIPVMIICIALAEEIKSLNNTDHSCPNYD